MNPANRVFHCFLLVALLLGTSWTWSVALAETDRAEERGNQQQEKDKVAGRKLKSKGRRCISPWFIYRGERSIELLRPNADIIASVSLCGGGSRKFVEQCHARFLKEASARLRGEGKRLAICVSYLMSTSKTTSKTHMSDFYDPETIGRACDMVRVMCYDMVSMSGKGVGPISTQPWARDAMKYWLQYVPREKLIMGLPAYSGDFEMAAGGKRERIYADKPALPEGAKSEPVWLPYEQIFMYRYLDEKGHPHLFFASDHVSTRAHLETVEKLDLPGIAFWHYEAVRPETWKVVRDWHERGLSAESGSWWLVFP